jgi:tryptophanyl-tRNA synthetase
MTTSPPRKPRILSGVQPSGRLHLGNYFGAIKQHIAMQDAGDCYYFIANYHSLTSLKDADALRKNTFDVAVTYLALGLDPKRTVFYRQSDVPEVTELAWLLATATGMGLLERAHSYKDKVAKGLTANVGLFFYPVLMAADILAPQADLVPVGQDQEQHVEMTRDMAELFHNAFCGGREPVFRLPKSSPSPTPRVPGTTFEKGTVLQVAIECGFNRVAALRVGRADDEGILSNDAITIADRTLGRLIDELATGSCAPTTEALQRAAAEFFKQQYPAEATSYSQLKPHPREAVVRVTSNSGQLRNGITFDHGRWQLIVSMVRPTPNGMVVFQTQDGRRVASKMSKSYGNTIEIFAEGKELKRAVMGIETQLKDLADPLDPDEDIVFALYSLFATPDERQAMADGYRAGGYGFGRAKKELLAKIESTFAPFRARRNELLQRPDDVEDVLRDGARRAREVARATIDAARAACGL